MSGSPREVVLWEKGPLSCTRITTLHPGQIVITLTANGVCVERRVFTDADTAAAYALNKMQAYNAG